MSEQPNTRAPRWGGIAAVIGVLVLISIIGSGWNSSSSYDTHTSSRGSSATRDSTSTPRADAMTSSTGAYMDEREKQLYEQDPSSMGYTDADRDFLKEHGVSEEEARAAETVLHREGIDD